MTKKEHEDLTRDVTSFFCEGSLDERGDGAMKVRITVEIDTASVKVLQKCGRLSNGMTARQALREEIEAVVHAHIEELEGEAEIEQTQ